MEITKIEILELLTELFKGCCVQVNGDNMELYDESPDATIDYDLLIKRIETAKKIFRDVNKPKTTSEIEEELRVCETLLEGRDALLEAIPECKVHGKCIPSALEWIAKAKVRELEIKPCQE